jgi:excisionase family DNA binding protein
MPRRGRVRNRPVSLSFNGGSNGIAPAHSSAMQIETAGIDDERSMLIGQAAELLGVSRRTIYYRIRDGRLRTIRTRCHSRRVLLSSVFELLREMREAEARPQRRERRSEAVARPS